MKHARHPSITGASRLVGKENTIKAPPGRSALGEVTQTAINRKNATGKLAIGKEKEEVNLKGTRSTAPLRVALGPNRVQAPPVTNAVHARGSASHSRIHIPNTHRRFSRPIPEPVIVLEEEDIKEAEPGQYMDVEEDIKHDEQHPEHVDKLASKGREIEAMIGVEDDDDDEEDVVELAHTEDKLKMWPNMDTEKHDRCQREVQAVRESYEDVVNMYDTTLVSEYSDEIFEYMEDLEESAMPNPNYMAGQSEITWGMRQTLVDWLLQVHLRYHMLPETLWITVNIVDRFLTKRIVSVAKLQLVGVTAMFIASKYEEILAPSVDEFVFVTENAYTKEEILKGETIILQTLDFKISHYCSPYSWMRRISKADDYELRTRTLGKFLIEVALLDHRFLRVKPSLVAAVGMYSARKMLGGDWSNPFVFHSGCTAEQLEPGHQWLAEKLVEPTFLKTNVCRKYANKKFLKASVFAIDWARAMYMDELPIKKSQDPAGSAS